MIYFWFYQRNKSYEVDRLSENMEALKSYATTVDQLYNDIRFYKHDISNILSVFRLFIEDKDMTGLSTYYEDKVSQMPVISDPTYKFIAMIQKIDSTPLKGLLLGKFEAMRVSGIQLEVGEIEETGKVPIDDMDLLRVLGILLDNAIEAAIISKEPRVILSVEEEAGKRSIKVSNSYMEAPIMSEISKVGYSTKGSGRGLGLESAGKTIEKYENVDMKLAMDKEFFHAELVY